MQARDPQAAELERAFVALQCRTRAGVARAQDSAATLDDALEVWRSVIRMASGENAAIRRLEAVSLRPELEAEPQAGEVALPARIDWLPSAEQNRGIYRFLALQLAGRREFGTYANDALLARLRHSPLEPLFSLAESVRVQHRVARAYPGSALESRELAQTLLAHWQTAPRPTRTQVFDYLFALALVPQPGAALPAWLPHAIAERVLSDLATLGAAGATVEHSLRVAERLFGWLALPRYLNEPSDEEGSEASGGLDGSQGAQVLSELPGGAAVSGGSEPGEAAEDPLDASSSGQQQDGAPGDATTASVSPPRLSAAQLAHARLTARTGATAQTYVYDEWDHTIGDYRSRHCRVHELEARHDAGEFFDHTRRAYASLLSDVRRHFERIRPERYRHLRGLEDGEDLDLNALTEARVETRARRSPQNRVYTARVRQTRDVATLFLLDMSASTEQPYVEPGDPPVRRIIDTLKETLVVMATALSDLGDSYAIYGFSSQGHDRVEVYPVKTFDDPLSSAVKSRIGGISPKSGTRMGAALRHSIGKFRRVHASSKHLILLSDGYPQDQEYGPDRRSRTYGIQDTAVALREANRAGITPFCITVDRAGHDYLREMCNPAQYLVIDEIEQLPSELPKIYRRVVLG
ncbi:MAG TPA: VWA domain-containing protein [Polyangiales bacterium]|nr:VWA domain-containing protein [Polyangiales bacterium]